MRFHTLLRVFLLLVLYASILAFLAITSLRPTDFFVTSEGFVKARAHVGIHYIKDEVDTPGTDVKVDTVQPGELWNGNQGFVVIIQWGSVLLAGLAAVALKALKHKQPAIYDAAYPDHTLQEASLWNRVMLKVRYAAYYQLPPGELWSFVCGGLSVLDALLVTTWLGMTVLYLYFCTERQFGIVADNYNGNAAQWALDRLDVAGDASGTLLLFLMMVMFFPVSRSSFLKWAFGGAFHGLIKYHRWMAWGTIWIAFGHSCLFFVLWGSEGTLSYNLSFQTVETTKNVMGTVSMCLMLVIAATANSWFRSTYFKIFYPVHVTCFVIIVAFAIIHSPLMAYWLLPALLVYAMDRGFRYWQLASNWTQVTPADFAVDGNMISLRLRWQKGPHAVQPGQTVYLRAPALSWFYSHPFSVADVEEVGEVLHVTVHIRQVGKWTAGLKERLTQGQSLKLQVEGPYESKLDYLHAAPVVVVIAGGTGVTPVLALLRRWARIALSSSGHVPQVHFVWTSRSLAELRLMGADLLAAATGRLPATAPKWNPGASPCPSQHSMYIKASPTAQPGSPMRRMQSISLHDSPSSSKGSFSDADGPTRVTGSDALSSRSSVTPRLSSRSSQNAQKHFDSPATSPLTGWLHAALHYTGLEFEQKQASVALDMSAAKAGQAPPSRLRLPGAPLECAAPVSAAADAKDHHLSAAEADDMSEAGAAPSNHLLTAHPMINPWVYTVCIILTFFCAWGGFMAGNFFISYGARHTPNGYFFLANGLMQFFCILIAAVMPTFLLQAVLLPLLRKPKHDKDESISSSSLRSTVAVLPGYVMTAADAATDAGMLQLSRGRPKFAQLLQNVREQNMHLQQIDVVVAGPDGICSMVQDLCQAYTSAPVLVCRRAAYHQ